MIFFVLCYHKLQFFHSFAIEYLNKNICRKRGAENFTINLWVWRLPLFNWHQELCDHHRFNKSQPITNKFPQFQPKIRYSDTSYIIHQQWQKGNDKATFPIVHNYAYNLNKFQKIDELDRKETERREREHHERKLDLDKEHLHRQLQLANRAARTDPLGGGARKLKRLRSRSADRLRLRRNSASVIEASSEEEENNDYDNGFDYVDVSRERVPPLGHTNVTVEVHYRPESTVQVEGSPALAAPINRLDDVVTSDNSENVIKLGQVDINHNSEPLMADRNSGKRQSNGEKMMSVSIRRKQFNPISDSSSWDESDGPDVTEYATVELRHKVNAEILFSVGKCFIN